ncbi:TetR/AcrR family transcriptional regulator [Streptomyces sp. NPDC088097]|uniref:TetR/AcrR family transcriptional regulator n=1 Tax=Streptomyces sp. NPDC088097 TaxID=3365823 RepID=UPI003815FC74
MTAKADRIPSVWARPAPAPRTPALNRAAIVREAIAMLDENGIEALSMRKLGARLGAGATSMYRHVDTKDELLELAVDEVLGEIVLPEADDGNWREAVTACAGSFRATALRHPWVCAELGQAGLASLGPNLAAVMERLTALFVHTGFTEPHTAVDALFSYSIGMSTMESAWLTTVARSGQSEARFLARFLPPTAPEDAQDPDSDAHAVAIRDGKFIDGLAVVLDGLGTRLPS